jgi:hypothetical protein
MRQASGRSDSGDVGSTACPASEWVSRYMPGSTHGMGLGKWMRRRRPRSGDLALSVFVPGRWSGSWS